MGAMRAKATMVFVLQPVVINLAKRHAEHISRCLRVPIIAYR